MGRVTRAPLTRAAAAVVVQKSFKDLRLEDTHTHRRTQDGYALITVVLDKEAHTQTHSMSSTELVILATTLELMVL